MSSQCPCNISQYITILFFQCKEVVEEDVDWIPQPKGEEEYEEEEEYYEEEEDEKGDVGEELEVLGEKDDMDKDAEEEAVNEAGGALVSLQAHINEMDEAGEP